MVPSIGVRFRVDGVRRDVASGSVIILVRFLRPDFLRASR